MKAFSLFAAGRFPRLLVIAGLGLAAVLSPVRAWAQAQQVVINAPERKHLFAEDSAAAKKKVKKAVAAIIRSDKGATDEVDVKANSATFLKETNEVKGTGGVIISRAGMQVQSDDALVNMTTKDATLSGKVVLSDEQGMLNAETGKMNLDSETGKFSNATFSLEQGEYDLTASELEKLSETEFQIQRSTLSTCNCSDDEKPWRLHSSRTHITEEGYAHTYGSWMDFHGVPIFYTPYLAFPVKHERQSGLLAGTYGYSRRDGLTLKLPVFMVLDDSSDLTVTPFLESKTRLGSIFDYRQAFSRYNRVRGRLLYSDDGRRGDDLRGTVTDDVFEPEFKEHRFGGYYNQQWTNRPEDRQTWAFIADVHYVNDNLFLREFDDEMIGMYNSRYTTSTILARVGLGDVGTAEISGEYNQSLVTDPDLTFQRLPELNVAALKSFRPFGSNPYGLKLVARGNVTATDFTRSTGYDGWRIDALPQLGVPFHVKNFVNGQFDFILDQTQYRLSDTTIPGTTDELDSSQDRRIYAFSYRMATGLERVYQLDQGNWLTWLTGLGRSNQENQLLRVKHTIEPFMSYSYIPDVTQDDLPIFDSLDRVRARSLVTYGFRTNLYGRFLPRYRGQDTIAELTPNVEDLPVLGSDRALPDLDAPEDNETFGGNIAIRPGEIRPIVSFGMKQNYDFEQRTDKLPDDGVDTRPLSDLNSDLTFFPSKNFALRFENNYSTQDQRFSSWGLSTHFLDDRGDALRVRYTFVSRSPTVLDSGVSQLEGNAEIALSQRLKLGYYTRYDNREREFMENRFGMRLYSAYDCWHFDLGVSDRINPDRQYVNFSFTFNGLGDVAQDVGYGKTSQSSP